MPLIRELDRIAKKIDQDLSEAQRIAQQLLRNIVRDVDLQIQSLFVGLVRNHGGSVVQHIGQAKTHMLQLQFAGLHLGDIQDVIDDAQQHGAGLVDLGNIVALLGLQFGLQRNVGQADDGAHGGADFMAHVGQEPGFRLRGLFGFTPRLGQCGDIDIDAGDSQGAAVRRAHDAAQRLE